jgi:hypothetical protein
MTFFYDLNKKLSDLAARQTLTEGTSHQAKTTMKHVDASDASPRVKAELKKASGDIKPGTAGYDDRARMLKAAGVKDTRGPRTDEGSTGDYSAKKAAAGKDIGKPGKNFGKIAASAGKKYGSKAAGERVAGAVLAKLRGKNESMGMTDEGNAFSKAVVNAKKDGVQPGEKIRVGGNTYPVKESLGNIDQILQQHASDIAKFKQTGELSDELYNNLFDYYSDNGEMPYGTQKARDGDPYEWIGDRLAQEIGTNESVDKSAFAKLAPPRDKITFADKIAGAKKEVDEMLGDVAAEAIKGALSPKQKKIDMNKNGKLDANDFAMLRKGGNKQVADEGVGQFYVYHKTKGDRAGGADYDLLKTFPDKDSATSFAQKYNNKISTDKKNFHSAVVRTKSVKKDMDEGGDEGGDEEKLFDAIAALYGDDIWDNDAMQDLVNDLQQAGPTDRELDFIITKGRLPRRLANIEFTNNDNVQFGEGWEDMQKYVRDRANSAKVGDVTHGHKHDIKHTATGRIVTRRTDPNTGHSVGADDDTPASGEKRGKGRPKGTGKSIGAKGPSGTSKLMKREDAGEQGYYKLLMAKSKKGPNALSKQEKEKLSSYLRAKKMMGEDEHDIRDRGEYDREGEMAQQDLKTAKDAADHLRSILDTDENLPEWVQAKITKAVDYLDTARDYMDSKDGDKAVDEEKTAKRDNRAERAGKRVTKDIEYDEKKKDGIHGKKRGAEDSKAERAGKKVTKDIEYDEKKSKKKEVDETTTSGSVATAPASGKTKAGSMFGKGVYESAIAESFKKKLGTVLTEGMSINMNVGEDGTKSLSVNATDEDAEQLAQLLKMAGLGGEESCSSCGQSPCGCDHVAEDLANSPSPEYSDTNTMVNTLSGGLNGRKSSGQTTIPVVNRDPRRGSVGPMAEATEDRLWAIYNRYSTK